MRSIVIHAAGDLRIEDRDEPDPGPGQVQVRIAVGGVCGTDLHYYNHGGFGPVRLKEPMILGHEVSGHVIAVGDGVDGIKVDDLVAISPSRPCHRCRFCREGLYNQCLDMRFYGSAMPFPHVQGAFREVLTVDAEQCVVADGLTPGEAAMAEPFSVALHATRRAGDILGKRVLVTGCGPIGVLCIVAARTAGAVEIVATDLADNALDHAATAGASRTVNVATSPSALDDHTRDKGYFDILYECSGAPAALAAGIGMLCPRGTIIQLGLGGDMSIPMMQVTAKELNLCGSFRFHEEFATAVALMRSGRVDLKPTITHTIDLASAEDAFRIANDRERAMKAQIAFA